MLEFTDLPRWLGTGLSPEDSLDLGALKTDLSKRGVSSRGWRLYLDHGDAMFNPLRKNWLTKQSAARQRCESFWTSSTLWQHLDFTLSTQTTVLYFHARFFQSLEISLNPGRC